MIPLYIATEDVLSSKVAESIVLAVDENKAFDLSFIRSTGNGQLKGKMPKYFNLSHTYPVLVITDLDMAHCPPALIKQWVGDRIFPERLLFRVAVRETESWLLADRDAFSSFFRVPLAKVPALPEELLDPKAILLNLVKRYAPKDIKLDLLPSKKSSAKVGVGYNSCLCGFVDKFWDTHRARKRSCSLDRAVTRIEELVVSL